MTQSVIFGVVWASFAQLTFLHFPHADEHFRPWIRQLHLIVSYNTFQQYFSSRVMVSLNGTHSLSTPFCTKIDSDVDFHFGLMQLDTQAVVFFGSRSWGGRHLGCTKAVPLVTFSEKHLRLYRKKSNSSPSLPLYEVFVCEVEHLCSALPIAAAKPTVCHTHYIPSSLRKLEGNGKGEDRGP